MKWLDNLLQKFNRPVARPPWMHPNLLPHQQDIVAMAMDAEALRFDWQPDTGKTFSTMQLLARLDRCPPGWREYAGRVVQKKSGKPFKSGSKTNTVKGIVEHPIVIGPAFTFEEDDSAVAVWQVELAA
jgi:hypothetical protein